MNSKTFFRKILSYFAQGLLILAPISITIYVAYLIFKFFDDLLPFNIPGLSILMIFVVILLTGFLASTIIARPVIAYFNRLINRTPFLKTVIGSIKDVLGAFVGKKKKFNEPVLLKLGKDTEVEQIGFVTCRDLSVIGLSGNKIAVYIPVSFSFTGYICIVPAQNVTPLNISAADALKFAISGGIIEVEKNESPSP